MSQIVQVFLTQQKKYGDDTVTNSRIEIFLDLPYLNLRHIQLSSYSLKLT